MPRLDYPDPPLTDGVVRLRRWELTDLACIEQAGTDPRIPRMTTVPVPYDEAKGRAFIERQWGRRDNLEGLSQAIADADTGEALGLIAVMHREQPGVVALGYWIAPPARRRGLVTRALALVVPWLLDDARADRVEAWVEPDNAASQRTLDGAGFTREGVLRSMLIFEDGRADAVVFSRVAGDPRD